VIRNSRPIDKLPGMTAVPACPGEARRASVILS
jgi:hypothetical protein